MAPTGAGTDATGRKGPLKLTGDQAPPKGGGADNAALPRSGTVTLVTGDRVRLDVAPDGRQTVTLADAKAARDGSGGLLRFDWAGEQFAVPYAAVPFLGSTLDPRLFDVSYLVRAGLDDEHSSTLPVTIQPSGSGKADELPGVRMAKGERAASATIDKSKARGLGRLLMKRWKESRGAGAAAKPLPVARIGLAATKGTPPPPEPPRAPAAAESGKGKHYRTLGLDFTGPDGKPATALGWVQNISDPTVGPFIVASPTPDAKPVTGEGPLRISVPDGTYSIAFTILTPHSGTYLGADGALVVEPELTVKGDRNITLDARTTKPYRMNLEPEVTGDLRIDSMTFVRTGVDGSGCAGYPIAMDLLSAQGSGLAASTLSASPTRKVTKGTLGFNAISGIALDSPSGKHAKPRYYLTFSHEGAVPPSLTYSVPESKLTTVHTRTYGQASGEVCEGSERRDLTPYVYTSGRSLKFGYSADVQLGEHTDYWYSNAPDRVLWSTSHLNAQCLRSYDSFRHIKPGERIEQEWGKAPVAPGQAGIIGTHFGLPMPGAGPAALCPACRQGEVAMLRLDPFGDSDPRHFVGYPDFKAGETGAVFSFYRNGTLTETSEALEDGGGWPHRQILPLLPQDAVYRLDLKYSRPGDPKAKIHTDWTFRSGPDDPPAKLPESVRCTPDEGRPCSLLPLLFVRYDLALDDGSRAKAGSPYEIAFTVAHQQGAPAPEGVTATVEASYDDGESWSDPVTATAGDGGGRFTAAVTHPPLGDTDGTVSLRVRARDSAGNTVDQTIIRAYGLAD
ncbi:hypothetical protein LUW76_18970 [Actinomadura madurae]|uniref:hypothetical protein n=1 Tax=Actinomadura madurae TaxID=1993 RepID=UPI0020273645|nr:hypothetical protein [Actinomadura madurae]URM96236.1 hypothetical protein LUW76_18970 [Actinomadura madurae]